MVHQNTVHTIIITMQCAMPKTNRRKIIFLSIIVNVDGSQMTVEDLVNYVTKSQVVIATVRHTNGATKLLYKLKC